MKKTEMNSRTIVALKSLFAGTEAEEVDAKLIRDRLSKATFHNYISQVNSAGYVRVIKDDPNDKRLTSKIALTDAGKLALDIALGKQPFIQKPRVLGDSIDKREVTITSVRRDIETLKQLEPELDILFDIRLKELPTSK
jgi:hypothetical protein